MRSLALVSLAIALLLAPSGGASVRIGSTECSVDFGAASGNLACTLAITGGGLTLAGSPVLTTQIAGTEPAAFRYDVLGELVAADIGGDVTSYTYDEAGRLTTLVDPGGETTRYAYDSLGRAVAAGDWAFSYSDVGLIRAVRADGGVVDYTYDSVGHVLSVSQDGSAVRFAYDTSGRIVRIDTPAGTIEYQYDGGELTRRVKNGQMTEYSYDKKARLVQSAEQRGETITYKYNSDSSLVRVTDGVGVTRFSYDRSGRLTAIAGPSGEVTPFGYDAAGLVSRVIPATGDDVVVDFQAGERNQPIVIGAVYTDAGGHSFSITLRGRLRTCSACP